MKRALFLFAALLLTTVSIAGCSQKSKTSDPLTSQNPDRSSSASSQKPLAGSSFQTITAQQAKEMMDKGNVTIVDVRRQDEYDAGHIKDAVLVPNESIGKTAPEQLPDKNAVLLVYCRTGVRSKNASQKLADLGYTQVYDFGGITSWPYETEK